ncbi:hypothetical protein [Halobacterium sp. KA-6]|uniref:hypothetical protein n=1 Tax=Halobacterium sp. KA-6 TaxID=2896368 RepID=UPI001E5AF2C3|nr:hypothetical protein [Halobacterium sp. KA-6]MCD2203423.1 hypothetical protein [Halobacterium sp. KA-6]
MQLDDATRDRLAESLYEALESQSPIDHDMWLGDSLTHVPVAVNRITLFAQ